jgi:hypothetical protein
VTLDSASSVVTNIIVSAFHGSTGESDKMQSARGKTQQTGIASEPLE